MPHLSRFDGAYYHTISATRNRTPVFNDPVKATVVIETLRFVSASSMAYVLAYAVLPDHLHLLLAPRNGATISRIMGSIKRFVTKRINEISGRSGPLWQQSFYDRIIRDDKQLETTIAYIHRNPVVAGLASTEEEFAFSSASSNGWTDLDRFFSDEGI